MQYRAKIFLVICIAALAVSSSSALAAFRPRISDSSLPNEAYVVDPGQIDVTPPPFAHDNAIGVQGINHLPEPATILLLGIVSLAFVGGNRRTEQ